MGFELLLILLLAFKIILSEITALAKSVRVVRFVGVLTGVSHLALTLPMVAGVAHVLSVVLLVQVVAEEHVLLFDVGVPVLVKHGLSLEVANGVLSELLARDVSKLGGRLLANLDQLLNLSLE